MKTINLICRAREESECWNYGIFIIWDQIYITWWEIYCSATDPDPDGYGFNY